MGTEYLTAEELAQRLRLKADTVKRWARDGKIPSIKLSPKVLRFDAQAVAATLARWEVVQDGR